MLKQNSILNSKDKEGCYAFGCLLNRLYKTKSEVPNLIIFHVEEKTTDYLNKYLKKI